MNEVTEFEGASGQKALAIRIVKESSPETQLALKIWVEQLLEIRTSKLSHKQKAIAAFSCTKDSGIIQQAITQVGRALKTHGWEKRSNTQRLGIAVAATTASVFGGANAGIAALGGAVAVPLWIVFGAGSMFAKVLLDELLKAHMPSAQNSDD